MKAVWLVALLLAVGPRTGLAASDHYGQVTFGALPVPGATVVATRDDVRVATITDRQGVFLLPGLDDGTWNVRVEMLGFDPVGRDVVVAADAPPSTWELTLLPFEEIAALAGPNRPVEAGFAEGIDRGASPGLRFEPDVAAGGVPRADSSAVGSAGPSNPDEAADRFLVNGSVNNGAASPFAQLAAFGNNRRAGRSLYNGGVGTIVGNSVFDARPFSFGSQSTPGPDYSDIQFAGTFGGPLRIPGLIRNGPNFFALYQRTSDHTADTRPARMPTALERRGDFSQTRDGFGLPLQIVDPTTGLPFQGGVIPAERISPQAAALLGYYPTPDSDAPGRYNYQRPVVTATRQDAVQTRLIQPGFGRNQLFGSFAYERTTTEAANVFGFENSTARSGIDLTVNWSRRFTQFVTLRSRYQFNRLTREVTPYFAHRANVSGDAGIGGNNQEAVNWGPPRLTFASGVEPLVDVQAAFSRSQTHAWNVESLWAHGRHATTLGGDVRWRQLTVLAQQNARGSFTFTGDATGSDLADFLLGLPHASSIAFGNADKYLRAPSYSAYAVDDWRFGPGLTVNAGIRWEYEAPLTERLGRLVNLDIAPGFTAVRPVVANNPVGPLTGRRYPSSLVAPDKLGVQPRVGVAWRPVAGSSLVVRAGYGIYRNTAVYEPLAMLMAQQPPLSNTSSVETSAERPLTLADGFVAVPGAASNTFAVDPDFRVGYSENWQLSLQRDLPASLTVVTTYLGTRGSRLMQQVLPNTYPSGTASPCEQCPAGFVYLTSNGRSIRHAGQAQLRRRLRNGLTASVQYTLSKAMDDAAFSVATGGQPTPSEASFGVAQDWLDLDAEWAPSDFDQRHQVAAQFQYTTGVGVGGGALMTGLKGSLFNGWTVTGQLTAGSGLPLTPTVLTSVTGTGMTGTIRGQLTGAPSSAPDGHYANPAAYAAPARGRWGNAARNSIAGPAQFGFDAGITRTFLLRGRVSLDWRVDAVNVLNRVTYAGVNTIVGSPQFGLPNRANPMRKITSSFRLRF